MNEHHTSNNGPFSHISTQDLQTATNYLNELIDTIREAHIKGNDLSVERLTLLMLTAFTATDTNLHLALVQQALMLSIALQRLAA